MNDRPSELDAQEIQSQLEKRGAFTQPCAACGARDWEFDTHTFALMGVGNGKLLSDWALLTIPVTCRTCGLIRFHSRRTLNL
jgi:ribosomal protein L37E